jgi:hypothetical protein
MDQERLLANYLPIITSSSETSYISHIWEVYYALVGGSNSSVSYSVMPYHLLYVMALNYKVLRMVKSHEKETRLFFCVGSGRNKKELLSANVSVAEIALINERTIPELFGIIDLDDEVIKRIKNIVDYRNETLGHPKLIIEAKPEDRINEYLETISILAESFKSENEKISQNIFKDIDEYDDVTYILDDFFINNYISPTDFGDMISELLNNEDLTFEQWQALVLKGVEFCETEAMAALSKLALTSQDSSIRFNAIQTLDLGGRLDSILIKKIQSSEKDIDIIGYLKERV